MMDHMTSINGLMVLLLCRTVDQTLAKTLTQSVTDLSHSLERGATDPLVKHYSDPTWRDAF